MKQKTRLMSGSIIHATARIAVGVTVWHGAQIAKGAVVGSNTTIGNNVYIDANVIVGKNCKIQSGAALFRGVEVGDGVFIGPHVCFTNDKTPRAVDPLGKLKKAGGWKIRKTKVERGVSIGANTTILPGVTIHKYAMVGAGSVITKDVPAFALVYGNPAIVHGAVDKAGNTIIQQ